MSTIYNLCLTSKRKLYTSCPAFLLVLVPHLQTNKTLSATNTFVSWENITYWKVKSFSPLLDSVDCAPNLKERKRRWSINNCTWEGMQKYTPQTTQIQNQMGIFNSKLLQINNDETSKKKKNRNVFLIISGKWLVCLRMCECALLCPSG